MKKTAVYFSLLGIGLLAAGIFVFTQMSEKDDKELVEVSTEIDAEEVEEVEEVGEPAEPQTATALDSLPNADEEAAKWNGTATDFIAKNSEYKMDAANIKKDEANSTEEISMFSHDFPTSLKTTLIYTVDNETKEITEMKLVGHEVAGADRAAIFYAMSIFISYVEDGGVTMDEGGGFLGEIPFASNEDGEYEKEFNGKKYDYILDLKEGTNTIVHRVVD
jgi:hypothetical protein